MPPYFTLPPHSLVKPLVPFLWIFTLQLHLHRLVMQWEKKRRCLNSLSENFHVSLHDRKGLWKMTRKFQYIFFLILTNGAWHHRGDTWFFSGFLITWPWSTSEFPYEICVESCYWWATVLENRSKKSHFFVSVLNFHQKSLFWPLILVKQ